MTIIQARRLPFEPGDDYSSQTAIIPARQPPFEPFETSLISPSFEPGRFISVIKGRRTGRTVDETMLPRRRANESQPSCCDIFPTSYVVSVLPGPGCPTGSQWSSARSEARGGGAGR